MAYVHGGEVLAVGGEFPTLSVIDPATREVQFELPVEGEVQSICLSANSICYNSGSSAFVYGAGGTACTWQDRPSFEMMTSLISTLAAEEEMLLRCVSVILAKHPSIVNISPNPLQPDKGPSLLQWAIENGCSSALLAKLMTTKCSLGLQMDPKGRTCLSPALEHGKSAHMQLLLEALVAGRFLALPGPMRAVMSTFVQWSYRFPSDFLKLVGCMPLQPEPEILGSRETQDVTLTRMLIRGSSYRCPIGFWDVDLDAHISRSGDEGEHTQKGKTLLQNGFTRTSGTGGLKALRIPFEGFAGRTDSGHSTLELILDAVAVTGEYGVFGKLPLQVLLDFKWAAFGQTIYTRHCILKAIDLVLSLSYYMTAFDSNSRLFSDLANESPTFLTLTTIGWTWTTITSFVRDVPSSWQAFGNAFSPRDRDEMNHLFKLLLAIAALVPLVTNALMLYVRTSPGALVEDDEAGSGSTSSAWLTLEAMRCLHGVAILYGCMLACFSFRGFLRFGSLVHMVFTVMKDIAPFLALTSIVLLGFSLALKLVTADYAAPNFHSYGTLSAVATSVDMGLYATTIDPELMHQAAIYAFYFPFMLLVQVVLLNLLVAIMSDSTQRNIRGADLVARYQRARLIVEIEPREASNDIGWDEFKEVSSSPRRISEHVAWLVTSAAAALKQLLEIGAAELQNPRPRWLHVLAPAEGNEEETEYDLEKELVTIRRALQSLQERCDGIPAAVERQMRLSSSGTNAPRGS